MCIFITMNKDIIIMVIIIIITIIDIIIITTTITLQKGGLYVQLLQIKSCWSKFDLSVF